MSVFIGIDVAKDTLAVAAYPGGEAFVVANDARGHAELARRLEGWPIGRILLEATDRTGARSKCCANRSRVERPP